MDAVEIGKIIGMCLAAIVGLVLGIKILIKGRNMQRNTEGVIGLLVIFMSSLMLGLIGCCLTYCIFNKAILKDNSMAQGNYQYQNNMNRPNYMQNNNIPSSNSSNDFGYHQ